MTTPADPVTTVTSAVSGLQDDLLAIGAVGIGISVAVFALRKGYKTVLGFIGR